MKEFLEPLLTPPDDSFLGWILLILLWICILAVLFIISYWILYALNYWFRPSIKGVATIVGMHFEPAHYTTTLVYNAATKTSLPMTTYHSDSWRFQFEVNGMTDDFYVTKEVYIKHHVGDIVNVKYTTGRIWGGINIKSALLNN